MNWLPSRKRHRKEETERAEEALKKSRELEERAQNRERADQRRARKFAFWQEENHLGQAFRDAVEGRNH